MFFSKKKPEPKVNEASAILSHRLVVRAVDEVTKFPETIAEITVRVNGILWKRKDGFDAYGDGSVFFDDPSISRLNSDEMKAIADRIFGMLENKGFAMEETGTGEKGTFRYHVEKYTIKPIE